MVPSASPASSRAASESQSKPFVLAAAVFVAVAAGSFAYLRTQQSEPLAHPQARAPENPNVAAVPVAEGGAAPAESQKAELQRERLLENVGSVSSIYLYQTYVNVGLLADAVKNETYSKKEASELLGTIMTLLQTVDAQTQKLETIGLDAEEVGAVKQVRKISALLKSQGGFLQANWKTGDQATLDQYQQVRRETWNELRSVLGLAGHGAAKGE